MKGKTVTCTGYGQKYINKDTQAVTYEIAYLSAASNLRPNFSLTLTMKPSQISIAFSHITIKCIPRAFVLFATACHDIIVFALPF